jgi:hypothetical protein
LLQEITGANAFFAFSLLSYHPTFVEKLGDGVKVVHTSKNAPHKLADTP